ncbi:MAG: tetratricopeptide repeat protein, partial [Promethearchaeota archaeon]
HQFGYILAANSLYDEAIKALNKAIELNKNSYDSFTNLAYIYIMKEDFQKTIEIAEESINIQMAMKKEKPKLNINTELAKPYAHLGYALYNTGEREQAIEYLEKSINLDPNYHRALLYLAKIQYDLKNFKEALKHINESLRINENFSEGIELRKEILELKRKGKKKDFIDDKSVI